MWVEILCGLIVYKLFCRFFSEDDVVSALDSSNTTALFSVAHRLEKLYGGKAYVGCRIPDADTSTLQSMDVVLVTKGEMVVISVKNLSGFVSVAGDSSWVCDGHGGKSEIIPDPVAEVKKQASILESYIEQRGVALPDGYLSYKVVLPNPKFSTIHSRLSSYFPSEVITYDQWTELKPEAKSVVSGWIKDAFRAGKKEMEEPLHHKLNFILSTAPMWDRLELNGNKCVLGEFMEFKGKEDDLLALRSIKRSKVSNLTIQKTSMFGLAPSKLQLLYYIRDYRSGGASGSEWQEATIRSSTEIVFRPMNSANLKKFKLSSVLSMSLST